MIAMKFGGTSVGSSEAMLSSARIVKLYYDKQPVVVISAMSGVTDLLIAMAEDFLARRKPEGEEKLSKIRLKHFSVVKELIKSPYRRNKIEEELNKIFIQLEEVVHGVYLLRELSDKSLALISSFGERLSVPLLAAILNEIGVEAQAFDARTMVRTDNNFLSASVDMDFTMNALKKGVGPVWKKGIVPIITGFIGSCEGGITTTLGRGGSDYSGAIVGAAFNAEEIWIWTDVSGVYSADPRVIKNARRLKDVTYQEAAEMSYFGAKVIHPKTMIPAVSKHIPIRIKNTFHPQDEGTLISNKKKKAKPVRIVTAVKKVNLVSVQGSGMVGIHGLNTRIFSAADRMRVTILMFSQASSGYNMSLLVPDRESQKFQSELEKEFERELLSGALDGIGINKQVAIVSIVGRGMRGQPGISGTLFSALGREKINIISIAQGNSEFNISFVIHEKDADHAVQIIHDAFALGENSKPLH